MTIEQIRSKLLEIEARERIDGFLTRKDKAQREKLKKELKQKEKERV